MIRSFEVEASAQIELDGQVYPVVTEADLANALARLAVLITYAGGNGFVMPQRIPTQTPNEMVTIRAIVTWQDRTNARPKPEESVLSALELPGEEVAQTPEPEQEETALTPEATSSPGEPAGAEESVLPFGEDAARERVGEQLAELAGVAPTSSVAAAQLDGLQVDPEAVDESDLPPAVRETP